MIEYKNSKHMICVHKSAFSAVSATRRSEKLSLLGTDPQTPRIEKIRSKNISERRIFERNTKWKIEQDQYK